MYYQVASKLVLVRADTETPQYSQAVNMAGGNGLLVEATAFNQAGGNTVITIEQSNDLENWSNLSPSTTGTLTGSMDYTTIQAGSIAAQYVRLKYSQLSAGTAVVAAGIDVADL